jgi:hypothetical protein
LPFTAQEITDAGKIGIDFYLRNKPIDQIAVERPLLKALMANKKSAPGAKQYIVEQLRARYQSNFQWFNGSQVVTYNKRQTIEQSQYTWRSAHDGFALDEDRLAQNGITVIDDATKSSSASGAEKIQLTNLIDEQSAVLRLGFEEKFSQASHLDGTQSADAIVGIDGLISLTPSVGTVGGIDRSLTANAFWRNSAFTGVTVTTTTGDILSKMETGWRACVRNGGKPNLILAGSTVIDGFRNFMMNTFGRVDYQGVGIFRNVDGGTDQMSFHQVPIQWSPEFFDLDTLYGPATPWEKRMYFINTQFLKLRPLDGHDMITRKPPRAYDKYEYYGGLTWRGAITLSRSNAQAVFALA